LLGILLQQAQPFQATAYPLTDQLNQILQPSFVRCSQSKDVEEKYYRLKPSEFFEVGGLSYVSCSS
jgi:hypothetical protein